MLRLTLFSLGCLRHKSCYSVARQMEIERRLLLPERVLMVRHGESEANVSPAVYSRICDNRIELTEKGSLEAVEAGLRIKTIVQDEKVRMFSSPFQRAYQTARNLSKSLESNILWNTVDPTIREQDMGNMQINFAEQRREQQQVGRFWYRFHNGESGADVYNRVSLFWRVIQDLNLSPTHPSVPNVLVVTHGLTMRLLLMRLYGWSPDTFETVWNPKNCDIWVLQKNLGLKSDIPYDLDADK